jgi:hypothetical protein
VSTTARTTDPFQSEIDRMPGWHACVLWTDSPLSVLPHRPDYELVARILEGSCSHHLDIPCEE